ncbi:MAG TPA: hypothetical protein VGG41_18005 [Solirubrobacteraceae bacterium]
MAELTVFESKLAEVLGLAMAAQAATAKVSGMLGDDEHAFAKDLERMGEEAAETERRCTEAAGEFEGKKTAILDQARETKAEASEMMKTYLADETDALDGFEFLTMAEAGEVGHWAILKKLNERADDGRIEKLVAWALPIQERHYDTVMKASLELAGDEDPNEPA